MLALVILAVAGWCSASLWFQAGGGEMTRKVLAAVPLMLAVATVVALATSWRWRAISAYAVAFALVLVWWSTILPSNNRRWTPDVAQNATATTDGDRLVITNLRNFDWRSEVDFDPRWETRTYDLSRLTDVDLILSYWAGEAIAHTILSFGFGEGPRLAFSIETRKEAGEEYSPIAGFFKQYELAIVAADERDVVRVRSNIRGEDVRIYRLRMTPANGRILLRKYIEAMNGLAQTPRFYNTLTTNCTTLVYDLVRNIHASLPMDPRVLLSGYLADYVYELGAIDTSLPLDRLRQLSKIHDRALRADADPNFSARVREGIPVPH